MPICKIYHTKPIDIEHTILANIENIILDGLEAPHERAEVLFIPATAINFGKNIYVELLCRNKPNRTLEILSQLANKLGAYISELFATNIPFKTRIIKIDEDHLTGNN